MSDIHTLFAPCPLGVERLLADELTALGATRVRASRAGVAFSGTLETAYRACLWSRVASRVLLRIAEVPASDTDELYESVRALPWEEHLGTASTFAVDLTSARSPIAHSKYATLRVKDAIVDRFRDREGVRPDVDRERPDVLVNVALRSRSAVVSIDLAGEPLHRRGYREPGIQVAAPLKENLAAAVVLFSPWAEVAAAGGALLDPMCGSGTLAIEAALIAADRAPGLLRARWGFEGWFGHDAPVWADLLDEADERSEAALGSVPPVHASDRDPRAVAVARACVDRAGLRGLVTVGESDVTDLPEQGPTGLVLFNPPYGERLGGREDLTTTYAAIGVTLRRACPGWRAAVIASKEAPVESLGLSVEGRHDVFNGTIPSSVLVGRIGVPGGQDHPSADRSRAPAVTPAHGGGSMFGNRLRKNRKRLERWARASDVTCYRVYDADMPEYAVAVDLYTGAGRDEGRRWLHVAEYAAPKSIEPDAAARRLDEALAVLPAEFGLTADDIFLKVRRRQRGASQYERADATAQRRIVAEGGLLFEIDLAGYLDTGLFLDHRITRAMVRDAAGGVDFLNLFAYTGSASVYAAAGGAERTVTVDMSATYLAWSQRNMSANGYDDLKHEYVQADVVSWLASDDAARRGPFGLIFCDPPTFSNSKRMQGTFDVQRDHVKLLQAAARLLAPGGTILFSNNRRSFKLDGAGIEESGLRALDITSSTIPEDFARNPRIHNTWSITHV